MKLLERLRAFWHVLAVDLAVAANVIILTDLPLLLQCIASLFLTCLLPGALLTEVLVGRSDSPPHLWERVLYSIGAGYSCLVLTALVLSYLPGGLTHWQLLGAFNLLWLLLFLLRLLPWFSPSRARLQALAAEEAPPVSQLIARTTWVRPRRRGKRHWLVAGMIALLLIAAFLRLTDLGYAELQGDEARLALRAAEVIQGYENALFVHKKGPVEILLPTVIYGLSNHLTETTARLPFALANVAGLFAVYLLGRRLFNPTAGWLAAMLLALDGYILGFGRVVQYQSIVFLMSALVVIIFHRLSRTTAALTGYLTLAALLLATGLLAHYEAVLVMIPVSYYLWRIWRQELALAQLLRRAITPVVVGGLALASFYLPFVRNPAFGDTYAYLTDYRMGGGSIFNHLAEFFARTTVYSSTYYLLMLIGLSVIGAGQLYWRNLRGGWRWLAVIALLVGMALTFQSATWLTINGVDYTWLFFAVAVGGLWLLPGLTTDERMVWLWFGSVMVLALFFTAIPNTHVYSFFTPWALLAGMVINRGRRVIFSHLPRRMAQGVALAVATVVIAIFGFYEYRLFVYNQVEVLRTWPENRPSGYWVTYDMPVDVAIFGFPLNNGWKAVAGLYADGVLRGNYDTNTRDVVADWYTRGQHRCPRDVPTYYILTNPVEPGLADETEQIRQQVAADHQLFGTVYVQGRPALQIYQLGKQPVTAQRFDLASYAARFDDQLTAPLIERNGPTGAPDLQHPLALRLGEAIRLRGYRLERTTARPGGTLDVTLYWQATQPIGEDYFVFLQLINLSDLRKAGQRDGQPGCNFHPTTTWLPGDIIADRYTLPIEPDALPGPYTLLVGMTLADQRLEIYNTDGQAIGNQFALATVTVQP